MIVDFGYGKCPFCGDAGRELFEKMFHCTRCDVAFDRFFVFTEHDDMKFWN